MTEPKEINPLNYSIQNNAKKISIHPLKSNQHSFSLTDPSFSDPTQSKNDVLQFLREKGLNETISIVEVPSKKQFIYDSGIKNVKLYQFTFKDIKICDLNMKVYGLPHGLWAASGQMPMVSDSPDSFDSLVWPDQSSVESILISLGEAKIIHSEKCWFYTDKSLAPALKLRAMIGKFPYQITVNQNKIFSITPEFFFSSGRVKSYVKNPVDGELHETSFDDFAGDGYLTNSYFKTNTNVGSSGIQRTHSDTHEFIYEIDDVNNFSEANVFVHANEMYSFYQSLGFEIENAPVIELSIHALIDGDKNNALCLPNGEGTADYPIIRIGDGDGTILKNLPFDTDVVSHEFGHYIIFQTLDTAGGESLVLHEGLADFFTMARTDDQCLGESICPPDSLACYVNDEKSSCLRTADNTLVYNSDEYKDLPSHLRGQLVSGFLWDIIEQTSEKEDITKLAFEAVKLLKSNDSLDDFLMALFSADTALFENKYCEIIKSVGVERGFTNFIEDIDCSSLGDPSPEDPPVDTVKPPSSTSSDSSDSNDPKKLKFFKCGVVNENSMEYHLVTVLFFIITLLPLGSLLSPIGLLRKRRFKN